MAVHIPALSKWRKGEDQTFKVMLGYIVNLRPVWMCEILKNFFFKRGGNILGLPVILGPTLKTYYRG